jgi:uncharacterized protein YjiS (DUF1127 family)
MIIIFLLPKLDAYRRYRKTVRELSRLSDEELDHVGVYRSDIDMVARASTSMAQSSRSAWMPIFGNGKPE